MEMIYNVNSLLDPNQDNILIHSGDFTNIGKEHDVREFIYWFKNLQGFSNKIFIAGNHDISFESKPNWLYQYINEENLSQCNCTYLEDSEFIIKTSEFSQPIKFYGSPWQPRFFDWAFNVDRDKIQIYWEKIPEDVQILITHGPPFGVLDNVIGQKASLGCESLLDHVNRIKPVLHIFGHIHSGHNVIEKNGTTFINASICTEKYKPIYKPIIIDLIEKDNKLIPKIISFSE
jgi:calcineurin-like phosphoesterase family protein